MKRLLVLLLTCLSLLATSASFGQIRAVKINLASAATGTASLSFEHVRKKQFAWQATIHYRPSLKGPNLLFSRTEEGWSLNDSKSQVIGGQLSYRWYTRKGRTQPTKPYFALFGQTQHWSTQLNYQFDDEVYQLDGNWSQQTFGLQYGVQWVIQDKWSIDLTLVGFGLAIGQLSGEATTPQDGNIGFWEESLGKIPFVGQRILLEGTEGDYQLSQQYTTIGLHTALRIGILF